MKLPTFTTLNQPFMWKNPDGTLRATTFLTTEALTREQVAERYVGTYMLIDGIVCKVKDIEGDVRSGLLPVGSQIGLLVEIPTL